MLLDCTLKSLQLFRDFVSICFIQTLINFTPLLNFWVPIGLINKAIFLATSILWSYVQKLCTWDIKLLEVTSKGLELQLQLLNMSLRSETIERVYFEWAS